MPWGISESAYDLVDRHGTYQYKAFGIPGLGLKRGLGDEVVVLTPSDSRLHTLDTVGGRIFELADGSRKVSEIAARIVEEFEVDLETASADAAAFVAMLVERKVLVLERTS